MKRIGTKAQVITQIFIYIAAAAIFLAILLFGYRFTLNILANQDTVLISDFRADLNAQVESLRVRSGSIVNKQFRLPQRFTTLCIADSTGQAALGLQAQYPQFYRAWRTNSENVFLLPKQSTPLLVEHLEVDQGYFCKDISGVFTLRFEGTGRTTRVGP